jgi:hypothetical protein
MTGGRSLKLFDVRMLEASTTENKLKPALIWKHAHLDTIRDIQYVPIPMNMILYTFTNLLEV